MHDICELSIPILLHVDSACTHTNTCMHTTILHSQLVSNNCHFRAVYDVISIIMVLVLIFHVVQDSIKAGRWDLLTVYSVYIIIFMYIIIILYRPHFDVSMAIKGIGSLSSLRTALFLELGFLGAAFLVFPCFKVITSELYVSFVRER